MLAPCDTVTDGARVGRVVGRAFVHGAHLVRWDGMPARSAKVCATSRLQLIRPRRIA